MNYLKEKSRTIVSLVTAPITQNIAIIRISGSLTYKIINKIFDKKVPYASKKPIILLGKIRREKEIIDQVLIFCFYNPNSFTGEDVVEISCHGNLIIVNRIIELILENEAELASFHD